MIFAFLFVILGFVALIFGANWLVDGASSLAKRYHVSDLKIGLTIVAFGTSAPELIVNGIASINGHSDIIWGNLIGSNNFNLFIILGITGIIFPITVQTSMIRKDIPISLLAVLLVLLLGNGFFMDRPFIISKFEGMMLLTLLAGFFYSLIKGGKTDSNLVPDLEIEILSNTKIWTFIILGLAGLFIGGKLVVDYSVFIATELGISQKIIGLTIVAAGTSLPELVTSIIAALKKKSDLAIGNLIGSNIFNLLLVLPISAFLHPIHYSASFNQDLFILIGGTLFLLLALFVGEKQKLHRWQASILVAVYLSYTIYLVANAL